MMEERRGERDGEGGAGGCGRTGDSESGAQEEKRDPEERCGGGDGRKGKR